MNSTLVNLVKINCPISRVKFFKYTFCIALLQIIFSLFFIFFTEKVFTGRLIIYATVTFVAFIMLPLLYLYFVQYTKRLWDITKSSNFGILAGAIIFVVSVISMVISPALTIAIYLTLILLPGKIVVNE